MVTYESAAEDPNTLSSKSILKVFADSHERLWDISTCGLRYYDYDKNRFLAIENDMTALSYCAVEESPRQIYMCIGDMLHTYDWLTNRLKPILIHKREVRGRFTALAVDHRGNVWAGTKTGGLICMDHSHTSITRYRANRICATGWHPIR